MSEIIRTEGGLIINKTCIGLDVGGLHHGLEEPSVGEISGNGFEDDELFRLNGDGEIVLNLVLEQSSNVDMLHLFLSPES